MKIRKNESIQTRIAMLCYYISVNSAVFQQYPVQYDNCSVMSVTCWKIAGFVISSICVDLLVLKLDNPHRTWPFSQPISWHEYPLTNEKWGQFSNKIPHEQKPNGFDSTNRLRSFSKKQSTDNIIKAWHEGLSQFGITVWWTMSVQHCLLTFQIIPLSGLIQQRFQSNFSQIHYLHFVPHNT